MNKILSRETELRILKLRKFGMKTEQICKIVRHGSTAVNNTIRRGRPRDEQERAVATQKSGFEYWEPSPEEIAAAARIERERHLAHMLAKK
jgi:hypothetical protein